MEPTDRPTALISTVCISLLLRFYIDVVVDNDDDVDVDDGVEVDADIDGDIADDFHALEVHIAIEGDDRERPGWLMIVASISTPFGSPNIFWFRGVKFPFSQMSPCQKSNFLGVSCFPCAVVRLLQGAFLYYKIVKFAKVGVLLSLPQ